MQLRNRTVLITGASAGIGEQIALQLAKEGANLIILGRDEKRLQKVKEEALNRNAGSVDIYSFDLADNNVVTEQMEIIRNKHKDLSIIINNAGIWQKLGDADQFSHDEIETIVNTNLTALIKVTNTLLPALREQDEAAIINIASKSGIIAQKGQSIYSATKYGVKGFTDVLKVDLAETKIRVAGVYQSGTNTDMFKKAGDKDVPVEIFTNPTDLADVVVFMLSRPEKIWLNEVHVNF